MYRNIKFMSVAAGLFTCFLSVYFTTSNLLAKTHVFEQYNVLFEIDTPRVIGDLTESSANHYRTSVHPIYVLMMNPLGSLLKNMLGSSVLAAIFINSFFGAVAVGLIFCLFILLRMDIINAALLSILFGMSTSQLVFSVVPDTPSLAICSLLFTHLLFLVSLQQRKKYLVLWVVGGVFSLGVTTTNFVQTLICFVLSAQGICKSKSRQSIVLQTGLFLILVVGVTILLSLIQKFLYPSTTLFFTFGAYSLEKPYVSLLVLSQPLKVIIELMKNFFLINVIAPLPRVFTMPETALSAMSFSGVWTFTLSGCLAASLWLFALTRGVSGIVFGQRKISVFCLGIVSCLVFNVVLHCFYGVASEDQIELFIYTGNVTFLVLLFLGQSMLLKQLFTRVLLAALIFGVGFNNFIVMKKIISVASGMLA